MVDRWDDQREDWERARRYRGEGYYGGYYGYPGERERGRRAGWGRADDEREYGRGGESGRRGGDDRGFFDRAGDEIRSWFGDDEAQRRRMRDEREYGREGYGGGGYGWSGSERYAGPGRGYGSREERDWARQWGWMDDREARENQELRRWNRQEGAETRGPIDHGRSAGYGRGQGWGQGGYPEREARRGEDWAGGDTWRYRETWLFVGPFAGRGPRNYQRSDDRILEDICDRMAQHGQLDAGGLEVRVASGEVTLSGTVNDRHAKRLAEDIAESVSGVREVHNQVRVSSAAQGAAQQQGWQQGEQKGWQGEDRPRAA